MEPHPTDFSGGIDNPSLENSEQKFKKNIREASTQFDSTDSERSVLSKKSRFPKFTRVFSAFKRKDLVAHDSDSEKSVSIQTDEVSERPKKKKRAKRWFWIPEPNDALERVFIGQSKSVAEKVITCPIFTEKIIIKRLGVNLRLFDLAGMLTNYCLAMRECKSLDFFLTSSVTLLSQLFKIDYSVMFQRSIYFVINYFSLIFFRIYRMSTIKTESFATKAAYSTLDSFLKDTITVCKDYDKVVNSQFGAKLSAFLSLIITIPFVEENDLLSKVGFNKLAQKTMKKAHRETNSVTWLVSVVECTSFIITKTAEVAYFGDLSRLTSDVDELKEYQERYNKALYLVDRLDIIEKHNFTLKEFLCEVVAIGELNQQLRTYVKGDGVKGGLKSEAFVIKRCQMRVLEKLNVMAQRDPPIAIIFNGPPGAGKTNVVDISLKVMYDIAVANGFCNDLYSPEMKYTYNWSSEFLSGWRLSSKVMLIDDVGQWTKNITEANKGGALLHFIDWVNGTPHITNQAELENKGTIPMLCEHVMMTTNFEDAGFSDVFQKLGGAWRRPFFIQMSVKPPFRQENSEQLAGNPEDETDANLHFYLPYRFDIKGKARLQYYWHHYEKKWLLADDWPVQGPPLAPYLDFKGMNEFYRDVVVVPHYTKIAKSKATMAKVYQGGPCYTCKGSTVMCSCPKTESGVDYDYLASDEMLFSLPSSDDDEVDEEAIFTMSEDEKKECLALHGAPLDWRRRYDMTMASLLFCPYSICKKIPFMKSKADTCLVYMTAYISRNFHPFDNFGDDSLSKDRKGWRRYLIDECNSRGVDWFRFMERAVADKALRELQYYTIVAVLSSFAGILLFNMMFFSAKKDEKKEEEEEAPKKEGKMIRFVPVDKTVKPETKFDFSVYKEISNKENYWSVVFEPLTVFSGAPSTITKEDLIVVCNRNIVRLELNVPGGVEHTHIFGLYGDVAVVNKHFFKAVEGKFPIRFAVVASEKVNVGPNTSEIILDSSNFFLVDNTGDLMLVKHPRLGTFRDIRKFFVPELLTGKSEGYLLRKTFDGEIDPLPVHAFQKEHISYHKDVLYSYPGYVAVSTAHSKNGDCGSPYIVKGRNGWCIASFHCAGSLKDPPYKSLYSHPLLSTWDYDVNVLSPLSYAGVNLAESLCTKEIISVDQQLHDKDPIRQLESGNFRIYGTLSTPRARFYSTVSPTKYQGEVMEHYNLTEVSYTSPRTVSTRECLKLNFNSINNKPVFPCKLVTECENHLYNIFTGVLDDLNLWRYVPDGKFDLYVGINGIDKVPHMERLVTKTSCGFPHKGPKIKHLVAMEPDDLHTIKYDFDKIIKKEYEYGVNKMLSGDRPNVIWDFNFKDEPISKKKLAENNVRIFNSAPVWFSTLERQCFLWCIPLFYGQHRHKFGMAMGANAVGQDWTVLYEYLTSIDKNRIIAGDYKKFDKSMPPELIMSAFNILIRIAKKAGFPEEDILLMRGVATEVAYPMTNCLGTLVGFYGSNPSGHPLTTVINSIVNIMYIMMASKTIEVELNCFNINYDRYFDYVKILTFGDDNIMSSSLEYINHSNISLALSRYGVIYTMAEKDKESIPFIHITEATFLKRRFAPDVHRIGYVAAPLEEDSIIKSLLIFKRSDSISVHEQNAASIYSACREYFQYGEDVYNEKRDFLNSILQKYDLKPYVPTGHLPTYEEMMDWRFS